VFFTSYLLVPLFVMGIPTILMGFSFPLLQSIVQQEAGNVGRFVGYLQALNIAGASLGALLTTFIAFPLVGSSGVLFFLVTIGMLVWLAGYYIHRRFRPAGISARISLLFFLIFFLSQEKFF